MGTFIESGHSKNIANFEHVITILQSYGSNYSPSKAELALANLQTVLTTTQANLSNVKDTFTAWKNATNNREIAFEPIKNLSTRLINTLIACGVTTQTVDDFRTLNRKMQGAKAKSTKADAGIIDNTDLANADTKAEPKKVSNSQRSFDSQIEHFDKMIKLLEAAGMFTPVETDIQVVTLKSNLINLQTLNSASFSSYTNVTNARIVRNKSLYDEPNGLLTLVRGVKAYIKGKFGADSPEYKQVSGIKFVRVVKGK
jgi:hypothetical protein